MKAIEQYFVVSGTSYYAMQGGSIFLSLWLEFSTMVICGIR